MPSVHRSSDRRWPHPHRLQALHLLQVHNPARCHCRIRNPPQYTNETATIQSNVPNASVTVTKYYKTVTSYDSGSTDASGNAAISFYISGATAGYTVQVTVTVGSASCSTSFTPQ